MSKLTIELCPETGICSIVKQNGTKIDLMPNEVDELRQAAGDNEKSKELLAQVDPKFSDALEAEELNQISTEIS